MACGEPSPGGGPWRIVTRDQELCEVTRLQVEHELTSRLASLDPFVVDRWIDASWGWTAKTTDGVVAQVRQDCGDEVADAVARAVADVRAHSVRTVDATCEDAERCLAKGAALGTRLAIENAAYYLKHEKPKPELKPNQGE